MNPKHDLHFTAELYNNRHITKHRNQMYDYDLEAKAALTYSYHSRRVACASLTGATSTLPKATAANPHAFAAAAFGLLAAAQVRDVLTARRRTRGDATPDVGEDAYAAVPSEDAATYAPFSVGDASSHSE